MDRSKFDNKTVSFEEHIKHEHNMWHYLYFITLIKQKDKTEFTGPESYVYSCIEANNLDWFPRMRAMSLDERLEKEKNKESEISYLKSTLISNNNLVFSLSKQLAELKEMVINFFFKFANY